MGLGKYLTVRRKSLHSIQHFFMYISYIQKFRRQQLRKHLDVTLNIQMLAEFVILLTNRRYFTLVTWLGNSKCELLHIQGFILWPTSQVKSLMGDRITATASSMPGLLSITSFRISTCSWVCFVRRCTQALRYSWQLLLPASHSPLQSSSDHSYEKD